jgi:hypothetical protein
MGAPSMTRRAVLFFANAYLLIFALDAVFALIDAATVGSALAEASSWRWPTMAVTLEAALPLYMLLGFAPQLPKRALLLPLLFLMWAWFGALPLELSLNAKASAVAIAAVQLTVAAVSFVSIRRRNIDQTWWVTAATTGRPKLSFAYTAKYFVAGLVLFPPLISVLTLAYAGSVIVQSAGGFISFAGDGVYAEEREYARDGKTIYLIGMVHVADRTFYEDVFAGFPTHNAVVLAEGVSDASGRFQGDLSGRDKLASSGGLTSQTQVPMPTQAIVEVADVDASELSENSVEFVNALMAALGSGDLREAAGAMRPYFDPARVDDAVAAIDELIELRNARLLEKLTVALGQYDHIIVPWGAAHMPGIERGVLDRGFELVERRPRRVVAFGDATAAIDG